MRRRQLSQGQQALNGAGEPPAAENLHGNGAGAPPATPNGQGAPNGAQGAPGGTAVATDGVGAAHLGRALSMQRRRQLSQGKQPLNGDGDRTAAAAGAGARLDPVTAGKVTVAQTWRGQRVTGPSVEHRPNVTGDEPGVCRPVTGTPYQGPSTIFGWCEPDEGEYAAQRLAPTPEGVAVTGDVPMTSEAVTGTERGQGNSVTGTPYYRDLRPAEPAADDWARSQAFPVALARRLAGRERDGAATQDTNGAAPPASNVPGLITGSFAVGEGMVTGNNEFLFRPRKNRDGKQPAVTGEGRTEGRTITGSPAAWTSHDLVTGTEGYIAAGRNPSEGGGGSNGWAGARRFAYLATHGGPPDEKVTGRVGGSPRAAARVTVSGGAQG